ncbi:MAG TPA: hypothetical protein ENJ08_01580 [Gammaproteobacteria bacterium]|nr:hypothetical protein [Gammaproteobacteria bacterium]
MDEVTQRPVARLVKVSLTKLKELERKCHNNLNWSDGGHWIGTGLKPNCFIKESLRNSITHTYNFPTDESAEKWNLEWEKLIRYAGHIGTAALTVAVTTLTGGLAGIAVGTIAAIIKDETQAFIPYPKMSRGWSYELTIEYRFEYSPHPWGKRGLTQTTTAISRDFTGKVVSRTSTAQKFNLNEIPDGLGRSLASLRSKRTSSDY